MLSKLKSGQKLVVVMLASAGIVASNAFCQSSPISQPPPTSSQTVGKTGAPAHYVANSRTEFPRRVEMYYQSVWGIDSLKVKYTESGEMIRFAYRVVDPAKAAVLSNKKTDPFLYDPQAGVKLVVPQMEKVGKLRQSGAPTSGTSYWMAFSNSGRRVRPGHRVNVEIGPFRAMNLLVE
jgi:hypothetical protein